MTVNLETRYLGIPLKNPLVAAASPLTRDTTMLKRLEDAKVAAIVLPSVFQEQIEAQDQDLGLSHDAPPVLHDGTARFLSGLSDYNTGPDSYLQLIECAKKSVEVPIIASLNASSPGDWTRYAALMMQAGADAIELNFCLVPTDPAVSSERIEQQFLEIVASVRNQISVPLAVKIGPYFTALPNLARQLVATGINGLVLFNRYLEPDIDVESLKIESRLTLSSSHELRLPLRWISILRDQVPISLAATSGIHTGNDAVKAILAGADVVMLATTLLRHGPDFIMIMRDELMDSLEALGMESVAAAQGTLSHTRVLDPNPIERADYLQTLTSSTWCNRGQGRRVES